MKKICLGILLCFLLTFIFSGIMCQTNWENKLQTLYAIAGIMFSIGMSIIVTSSFSKIINDEFRKKIKREYNLVRNCYIIEFLLVSIFFIFQIKNELNYDFNGWKISFSFTLFTALSLIYSIIFFIFNFIALQKLNNDLDDAINSQNK